MRTRSLVVVAMFAGCVCGGSAFASSGLARWKTQASGVGRRREACPRLRTEGAISMRDRSSVDFEEGQWVRVVDDVVSGNVNMKGMQGKVVYAWEKCEVDPTCCCAELSMEDASVQVLFTETTGTQALDGGGLTQYSGPDFKAYFSPDELQLLTPTPQATKNV